MGNDKQDLRQKMEEISLSSFHPGKTAENLRKQDIYRRSSTLFVSPAPQLSQIRINALLDGKLLLMPGPALKKGFYRLKPYTLSFTDLGHAVSLKGIEMFGTLLHASGLAKLHIDLALTDCLAIDPEGGRLGMGTGFFDLAMGILGELGAADSETEFGAVGVAEQLVDTILPQDSWDVKMNFFLQSQELHMFTADKQQTGVVWEVLEERQIRKAEPLWQLFKARSPK